MPALKSRAGSVNVEDVPSLRANGSVRPIDAQDQDLPREFLEELLRALTTAHQTDAAVRMPTRRNGITGEIARAFNVLVGQQQAFATELSRVARVVGRDGRTSERFRSKASSGVLTIAANAANSLIDDLVRPTNEITRVISAVAEGDLTQNISLTIDGRPAKGDIARIGTVVNSMVDQLRSFSVELTRT